MFNGPTLRVFECPECHKRRLHRLPDHEVIREKKPIKLQDGRTVEHHIDVCEFCLVKLREKFYKPTKSDLRKVLKALHDPDIELGNDSLEDML